MKDSDRAKTIRDAFAPQGSVVDILVRGVINSFVLALGVIVTLLFVLGSYDTFRNVQSNKCQMTWMFEHPEYIPIKLGHGIDQNFEDYRLYAYAEGRHAVPAGKLQFSGIPVLYVPGNAGSFKQVRSFASVALRKWLDAKTPFHFDFFTVDLNEELSGLYGYVLYPQSEFVQAAVNRILELYEDYHYVVLIGHSMGGIVAKRLIDKVQLIITLSTPHLRPIVIFDPEQDLFYYHLSRNWSQPERGDDVNLVSVAGGERDWMVAEGLTKWQDSLDIHTTTTAVPGVWASTDHLCIVWCKQFVLATVRALFDMVEFRSDTRTYAISTNRQARLKALNYHFVKKTAGKSVHSAHRNSSDWNQPPPQNEWNELLVLNYCTPPTRTPLNLMFPMEVLKQKVILSREFNYRVLILTTNTAAKNWVFGCTSQSFAQNIRYCSKGDNLSELGEIIPHLRRRRKNIHLNFTEVSKYSHLIVRMDPATVKTCVQVEVYNIKERQITLAPRIQTEGKIFYNMSIQLENNIWSKILGWRLSAVPIEDCPKDHNSLAVFQHSSFSKFVFLKNETLSLKVTDWNASKANVILYLEPSCRYNISVGIDGVDTAGQIFRTYWHMLPSFICSIFSMSLFFQRSGNRWSNFHRLLISKAYHLTIIPGITVPIALAVVPNDWPKLLDNGVWFVFLPLFGFLVAHTLLILIASALFYMVITSGNVIHSVFIKILATKFGRFIRLGAPVTDHITDFAVELTFSKFPIAVAVLLVSLTVTTCGTLGMFLTFLCCLVKLLKLYEGLLHDLWRAKIEEVTDALGPFNFQFSCTIAWLLLTGLNLPSLIHWIKGFKIDTAQWDLSMYLCLMTLPTIAVLWQEKAPCFNELLWKIHRFLFYFMGIAMVLWGTFRLYILSFLLTLTFLTTAMVQLISFIPTKLPDEENEPVTPAENSQNSHTNPESSDAEDSLTEDFPILNNVYDRMFEREKRGSSSSASTETSTSLKTGDKSKSPTTGEKSEESQSEESAQVQEQDG